MREKYLWERNQNESTDPGQSCTQSCKCYSFAFKNGFFIRMIDTPGVGDTRGPEQEKLNFENILAFIGQYEVLHCICMLFKPNNSKITVSFEYCFKQLICHLDKTAKDNIVFLFTNARSTFYRPGDSVKPLKKLLDDLKNTHPFVNIPFNKETFFCFDNEAFRFLVALKNGITFSEDEETNFANSWILAAKECVRLMDYIMGTDKKPGLTPHLIKNTLSVNEVRRQILNLSRPLANILENIDDNLKNENSRMEDIQAHSTNIEILKQNLSKPYIDLELIPLDYPKTVCSSLDCVKKYEVLGRTKINYVQICHDKCSLSERVKKDTVGHSQVWWCRAFNLKGKCKKCQHNCGYEKHLHIYYDTKTVAKQRVDNSVKEQIEDEESAKRIAEQTIEEIKDWCDKNLYEVNVITRNMAKMAHFLKNNAIATYNDSFKIYLEKMVENESIDLKRGDINRQGQFQLMMDNYEAEKRVLDHALNTAQEYGTVTAENVLKLIEELQNLPINGKKIKEFQEQSEKARDKAHFSFRNEYYFVPKKYARTFEKHCDWKILRKNRAQTNLLDID